MPLYASLLYLQDQIDRYVKCITKADWRLLFVHIAEVLYQKQRSQMKERALKSVQTIYLFLSYL